MKVYSMGGMKQTITREELIAPGKRFGVTPMQSALDLYQQHRAPLTETGRNHLQSLQLTQVSGVKAMKIKASLILTVAALALSGSALAEVKIARWRSP